MTKQQASSNNPMLASSPVVLTVELGRLTLTGAEVAALAEGHVVETGFRPGKSAVTILVSGQPWATGELVDVEGVLGVQIRRLLAVPAEGEINDEVGEA